MKLIRKSYGAMKKNKNMPNHKQYVDKYFKDSTVTSKIIQTSAWGN
jgi:hypothetical protein